MSDTYYDMLDLMSKLDEGDEIEIESRDLSKNRRVVVTGRMEDGSLLLTSGHVRRGHFTGGRLKDYGEHYGVQYSATMQQPLKKVAGLRLVRKASKRN